MSNISRYLITTADERTWRFDQPVIFLGEWCKLYERQHIWQNMDAIVAEPYGLDINKKIEDNFESRNIEKILLTKLTHKLNNTHQTAYSERFWKILIGHWLRTYIETGLNRIKTLENCIATNKISGATFIELDKEELIPTNFASLFTLIQSDTWNSAFDLQIIKLLNDVSFKFEVISDPFVSIKQTEDIQYKKSERKLVKNIMFHSIKKVLKHFTKSNDALIINTYLPIFEEVKLNFLLGQFPRFWESEFVKIDYEKDLEKRKNLSLEFTYTIDEKYIHILSSMLFNFFPSCYLEGFVKLGSLAQEMNFPSSPKFIFTSNSYHTDEVFKYWSGVKTEEGAKYIVGQHGSNFGTNRFFSPSIEEEICSTFLTWGWRNNNLSYKPSFIFKTVNKNLSPNSRGKLLLNQLPLDYRRNTWDTVDEHYKYFEDQKIFISNLFEPIRRNTIIRLHGEYETRKFNENLRWLDFDESLELNYQQSSFFQTLSNCRLVVHSYDSTGFLESLALNIPTMAFWQNGFDHLVEDARPYYQELVDNGIIHLSPKTISEKINNEWDDIQSWWNTLDVQNARNQFCKQYARQSKKPVRELHKLLTEDLV
jgi:putative transferase (TIGR04331 family)